MTDLPYTRSTTALPHRVVARGMPWIALLYATAAAAGSASVAIAATAHPSAPLEWQLALLLRFMALVKGAMVLGAIGLTHWRLRQPIGDGLAAGYIASIASMLLAPGLIWSLAHVAMGAGVFHAGLLGFLVLAWRDDAAGKLLPRRA